MSFNTLNFVIEPLTDWFLHPISTIQNYYQLAANENSFEVPVNKILHVLILPDSKSIFEQNSYMNHVDIVAKVEGSLYQTPDNGDGGGGTTNQAARDAAIAVIVARIRLLRRANFAIR